MLPAGTIISDFRIEDLLGEGGMATVYEAHQISLDRTVALKVLAARLGDDPDFQERFRRECQIQARLDHPHIVPIHAAGNSQYGLWLAMRLVRGPTLRELLLEEPLPPAQALSLLAPVAAALDVAHDSGLIHRDITPQNILIERNEHPFLSDFGITRGKGDRSLTQTGQFLGTLDYVTPEQIRDEPIATTADIYSFGAVLFECLAGRVPFEKKTDTALMWAHVHEEPPLISQVNPSLPKALDPVLGKALAKLPGSRYAKASDLIADAAKALSSPPSRRPPPPGEEKGRSFRLVALISIVAVGLAALALGAMSSGSADTDTRRAVSGDLAVEIPRDWTVSKVRQSPIGGLPLEDPAVLSAGQGRTVTIGMSGATGKSLLPPGLLPPAAPDGEPVALGELEALRYPDLPTVGSSLGMAAFVVPAEGGVATVACRPGAQGSGFFDACQRIASTLELVEGGSYPLGPSPAFARALRRQLTILDRRRSKLTKRLDAAETADEQAAAASGLKAAFRRAARNLSSLRITPQSAAGQESVATGLRAARDAYAELSAAASREDAVGYANAARIAKRAEDRVDRRLRSLERLGYRVEE